MLDQFEFSFQPSINERQIRELQTLRFVHNASNVIFLGPPGVGKTHLGVALATEAIHAGFSAYFLTAQELVSDLEGATREGCLDRRLRIYLAPESPRDAQQHVKDGERQQPTRDKRAWSECLSL